MKDIFAFKYELGINDSYDYWLVEITTKSGKKYRTKSSFYCSITFEDKGKVVLGLMGTLSGCMCIFRHRLTVLRHLTKYN
ncbi:hypothetical protein LHK12_01000 [Providencia rettgeri]|nr:hypothetical protein [Providencia rettgeri]